MNFKKLLKIFRSVVIVAVFVTVSNNIFAQEFITLWDRTVGNEERPEWFSDGTASEPDMNTTERGITYNTSTGHVYVCSRKEGLPSVYIIDPLTGEDLGTLPTTGIPTNEDGGGYVLNNIVCTEAGQIVACNMTLASNEDKPFRVFRWLYEGMTSDMIIEYDQGGYRIGDKFSVHGDLAGDARIYAVPNDGNTILKWTVTNGVVNTEPEIITLSSITSIGLAPNVAEVPGSTRFYAMGRGHLPTYFEADGTNLTQVSISSTNFPGHAGRIAESDDGKLYMAMYQGTGGAYQRAALIDISQHGENVGDDDIYGYTPSLSSEMTGYGAGAVDVANIDGEIYVFVCAPDIGIAGYRMGAVGVGDVYGTETTLNNYPNPFNSITTIEYSLPEGFNETVTISVYNITGKLIREFNNTDYTSGKNNIVFDATELPDGIYIYKIEAGNIVNTKKMVIIK